MKAALVGMDPGLDTFGIAAVDAATGAFLDNAVFICHRVEFAENDTVSSLMRAAALWRKIHDFLLPYDVKHMASEMLSQPQSAGAATKIGISFGVIAATAASRALPVWQVRPTKLKEWFVSDPKADKRAMMAEAERRAKGSVSRWGVTKGEHAADAMAVAWMRWCELNPAVPRPWR